MKHYLILENTDLAEEATTQPVCSRTLKSQKTSAKDIANFILNALRLKIVKNCIFWCCSQRELMALDAQPKIWRIAQLGGIGSKLCDLSLVATIFQLLELCSVDVLKYSKVR